MQDIYPDDDELARVEAAWDDWGYEGAVDQLAEDLSEAHSDAILDDIDVYLRDLRIDKERFDIMLRQNTPHNITPNNCYFDQPDSAEILRAYPEMTE